MERKRSTATAGRDRRVGLKGRPPVIQRDVLERMNRKVRFKGTANPGKMYDGTTSAFREARNPAGRGADRGLKVPAESVQCGRLTSAVSKNPPFVFMATGSRPPSEREI
jgi:hypothetical protein